MRMNRVVDEPETPGVTRHVMETWDESLPGYLIPIRRRHSA